MSREMRSCRSRRACSTFVSASVGGSQEKSSTSGGREAQGAGGVLPKQAASRNPQPQTPSHKPPQPKSSPEPFRAMLPLSPLDSPEVTHKPRAFRLAPPPPCGAEDEGGNDALCAPTSRCPEWGVSAAD